MLHGAARLLVHMDTGLLASLRVVENVENGSRQYQTDTTYTLNRMRYGTLPEGTAVQIAPERLKAALKTEGLLVSFYHFEYQVSFCCPNYGLPSHSRS